MKKIILFLFLVVAISLIRASSSMTEDIQKGSSGIQKQEAPSGLQKAPQLQPQLLQSRNFTVDITYHSTGTGYGEVYIPIKGYGFTVSSPAMCSGTINLTTSPSLSGGSQLIYYLYPDPSVSGCSEMQMKWNGYCYPVECPTFSGSISFKKTLTQKILNENGKSWMVGIGIYIRGRLPAGDYRIKGTISVSFMKLIEQQLKEVPPKP